MADSLRNDFASGLTSLSQGYVGQTSGWRDLVAELRGQLLECRSNMTECSSQFARLSSDYTSHRVITAFLGSALLFALLAGCATAYWYCMAASDLKDCRNALEQCKRENTTLMLEALKGEPGARRPHQIRQQRRQRFILPRQALTFHSA